MSKVQKTFYLNPQLDTLVDHVTKSTGASFTKIVTAALIKYLLGTLRPPSPKWMQYAVALERGDLELPDILLRIADDRVQEATERLNSARKRRFSEGVSNTYLVHCDEVRGLSLGQAQALHEIVNKTTDKFDWLLHRWISFLDNRTAQPSE